MRSWIWRVLRVVAVIVCVSVGLAALSMLRSPIECERNSPFFLRGTADDCEATNRKIPQEILGQHQLAILTP